MPSKYQLMIAINDVERRKRDLFQLRFSTWGMNTILWHSQLSVLANWVSMGGCDAMYGLAGDRAITQWWPASSASPPWQPTGQAKDHNFTFEDPESIFYTEEETCHIQPFSNWKLQTENTENETNGKTATSLCLLQTETETVNSRWFLKTETGSLLSLVGKR